jgi:ribosomal protein S18 acetylase RimI-like enzyme
LYNEILVENRLFDSDIPGVLLERYTPFSKYRLYLISAAIHPEYQGKGLAKYLVRGFYGYLLEKKKENIYFTSALSTAVTSEGRIMLDKMGFMEVKKLNSDYTICELLINDETYRAMERKQNENSVKDQRVEVKTMLAKLL